MSAMKRKLVYVQAPERYSPAWIGNAFFSKSGRTMYFNGKAFKNGQEIISGDIYWISGVKKDMTDRLFDRTRKIQIDQSVVDEYLEIVGLSELPKSKFEVVTLNNDPPVQEIKEIENEKSGHKPQSLYQNEWKWQRSKNKKFESCPAKYRQVFASSFQLLLILPQSSLKGHSRLTSP